jgi:hypothetical protein
MVYNPERHTQVIAAKLRVVGKSYKSIMRNTKTMCETRGHHGPLYSSYIVGAVVLRRDHRVSCRQARGTC